VGIRETLNQNPGITTGATAAIILVALGIIVWQLIGSGSGGGAMTNKAFYTIDDGKTYFADDINKIAPFDKDGKPAYQVFVWTCDGGKNKFVSHLQRYTPEAKKRLEDTRAKGPTGVDPGMMEMVMMTGVEVKPPLTGDKGWTKQTDPNAMKITQPTCKVGKPEDLEPVMP
jgi:hypothetical protein